MMTDYEIVLKRILNSCTDFTINGKCSNCGECCGSILPVTKKEIKRIKAYVRKHNIKPHKNEVAPAVEMVCFDVVGNKWDNPELLKELE